MKQGRVGDIVPSIGEQCERRILPVMARDHGILATDAAVVQAQAAMALGGLPIRWREWIGEGEVQLAIIKYHEEKKQ